MADSQELAELSISLKATDVNVEKTLNDIKTSFKKLEKDMNDVFNLTSVKSAIKDIQTMSNEIKSTVSQINGIANNIQSVANETSKLAKATGMKKLAKDVKEVSQETKKINFDGVKEQISSLSNRFGELSSNAIKYANTTSSLSKQVSQFNALSKTIALLEKDYDNSNSTIQQLKKTYNELAKTMNSAKGIKVGFGTDELKYGQVELSKFRIGISNVIKALELMGSKGISSISKLSPMISSAYGGIKSFKPFVGLKQSIGELGGLSGIGNQISSSFSKAKGSFSQFSNGIKKGIKNLNLFSSTQKKANKGMSSFNGGLKTFLRIFVMYSLAMNVMSQAVFAFSKTIWSALNTNDQFVSSLNNIKANLAVAFMPIYTFILPAVNALMSAIASVTRVIASLIASVFGTSYEEQLKKANDLFGAMKKNEEAEKGGADSAKKKTKEYEKQLHAMDEINNLTMPSDSSGGGGSGGAGVDFEPMEGFGTDVTELKKKLMELFSPITESWNKYGQSVMDSFKFALESIKGLISSIGESLKEVWLNGTGEQTFDYIFQILSNILTIIGNISVGLRIAWEQNNTGTQIIQALWNAFNNVLGIVYDLTDALVKWSYQVDFSPLLNSVLNLSLAFEKLTGAIRDKLAPIFNTYLTPILNFLVEKVIPSVINGIAELTNALSSDFSWLGIAITTVLGSVLTGGLTSFISTMGGLVGALTSGFGALLVSTSGLVSKVPLVGSVMKTLGTTMMSLNGTVLLLGGAFFYLLGSNDELQKFVNDLLKSFSDLISKIDFGKLAQDMSNGIANILSTIANGISGFDWTSVGNILSTAISGLFDFVANIDFGSIIASLSEIVNSIIVALGEIIASIDWGKIGENLMLAITNLLGVALDFILNFDWLTFIQNILNLIGTILGGLVDFMGGLLLGFLEGVLGIGKESVMDLWNNYLAPFGEWIMGVFKGIWETLSGVVSFLWNDILVPLGNFVKDVFMTIWDALVQFFKNTLEPTIQVIIDVAKNLWEQVLVPFGNFIKDTFTSIWQGLVDFFNNIVKPIIKAIGDAWNSLWNNVLKPIINWVGGTFKSLWQGTMNTINSVTNTIKSTVTNVWNSVKSSFNSIISFVKGSFSSAWSSAWNGIKSIFSKVFNSLYNVAKSPINMIIGAINKMIDGVEGGINAVIRGLNRFRIDMPDWLGGGSFGFHLSTINLGHIPKLASGGIAYGDTLVQVAEYQNARSNPEVIAPLDKLNGIMYENLKQILSNGQNQFDPNEYDIVTHVELKTENETLAKSVAKGKAKLEKKTGKPLFGY